MRAYHLDLRSHIVAAVADGTPVAQVARQFRVHRSTVFRYLAQQRDAGTLSPRRHPGAAPRVSPDDAPQLIVQLTTDPTATLAAHCQIWEQTTGIHLSQATMSRTIRRLGWSRKKGVWQPANGMPTRGLPGGTTR
jgi:transposase